MYKLSSKIEIIDRANRKKWVIENAHRIDIKEDVDIITDTMSIELPKRVKWDGSAEIPKLQDCEIVAYLGYDNRLELAFKGIVRSVQSNMKLVIYSESEITRYKTLPTKTKSYNGKTFAEILKDQGVEEVMQNFIEDKPINFTVYSGTVYGLMQRLQRQGVLIKMVNRKGVSSIIVSRYLLAYNSDRKYSFYRNIISGTQEKDLEYRGENFGGLVSIQRKGYKKEIIRFGVDAIDQSYIKFWNRQADKELWAEVDKILRTSRKPKDYYRPAEIVTFGAGLCKILEKCEVEWLGQRGDKRGEKGDYVATKIETTFGIRGFRQRIVFGVRDSKKGKYFED